MFSRLRAKIRLTIGAKLIGLIAILLISSLASLVWLATRMFIEDNTALIQNMNADTAASLSARTREFFETTNERMRLLGMTLLQQQGGAGTTAMQKEIFLKDPDFLALYVYKHDSAEGRELAAKAVSPVMAAINDATGEATALAAAQEKTIASNLVAKGDPQIAVMKLGDGSAALAVAIPFIKAGAETAQKGAVFSHSLLGVMKQSRILKMFTEADMVTAFMVDGKGRLIAHADTARVLGGESVAHLEIVKMLLGGKFNNSQTRYADQAGEWKLGAFKLVGFGGLGVVAEVPEAKAFEAAHQVERRAAMIAIIILSLSFFIGYLYSGTITWPIKQLVGAAKKISSGDFTINLKPKTRDELATLSLAFNDMAKGLEERDKVKATFNKFHNKEIAEKLLSGEVKLGGERKESVVFFSDVRGFTAMSESMQPEQVVEMLNEYMTRMVAVIRAHHGIVDKYVGDAIMALWGVPIGGPDDVYNAIMACLLMRQELAVLNELRLSRGQSALKIGMGVNTGPVIAGNIGSTEKMEYTVIGDTVNLASRIESMTKTYGTDLLISEAIHASVKDRFIFENCKTAHVKGKTDAIVVYKVSGYYDENGTPVIIKTPYSSYTAEHCDKVKSDGAEPAQEIPAAVTPPPFTGHNRRPPAFRLHKRTQLPPPFKKTA
ncbi:MAG: hypothetical protein A2583_10255 [Bdellovibrionales bacterium RIFOXYD1_FULL_53_11]|nr:MAG: hypothetical protein A2583_10255 [Bdellovibrionales bacterium RIFOXYD1_FULL_53_11]